jgi:hypothetical protein
MVMGIALHSSVAAAEIPSVSTQFESAECVCTCGREWPCGHWPASWHTPVGIRVDDEAFLAGLT